MAGQLRTRHYRGHQGASPRGPRTAESLGGTDVSRRHARRPQGRGIPAEFHLGAGQRLQQLLPRHARATRGGGLRGHRHGSNHSLLRLPPQRLWLEVLHSLHLRHPCRQLRHHQLRLLPHARPYTPQHFSRRVRHGVAPLLSLRHRGEDALPGRLPSRRQWFIHQPCS